MNEIKIYRVGDYEWIAAKSSEDAEKLAAKLVGETVEDYRLGYDEPIRELTDEEMNRLQFLDEIELSVSFREKLDALIAAGTEFPMAFATTEI